MGENKKGWFVCFAQQAAHAAGSPYAFMIAAGAVVLWALSGPFFGYSDTWQLVINTSTTIITFLMVFLIQNTQNRDSKAMQLKLDELIRSSNSAHAALLDLEELDEEELEAFARKYHHIAEIARERLRQGKSDTEVPDDVINQPLKVKQS